MSLKVQDLQSEGQREASINRVSVTGSVPAADVNTLKAVGGFPDQANGKEFRRAYFTPHATREQSLFNDSAVSGRPQPALTGSLASSVILGGSS